MYFDVVDEIAARYWRPRLGQAELLKRMWAVPKTIDEDSQGHLLDATKAQQQIGADFKNLISVSSRFGFVAVTIEMQESLPGWVWVKVVIESEFLGKLNEVFPDAVKIPPNDQRLDAALIAEGAVNCVAHLPSVVVRPDRRLAIGEAEIPPVIL